MSASDISTQPHVTASAESKSARKKKAKAEAAASQTAGSSDKNASSPTTELKTNGTDNSGENSYVKELQKGIRNVNKKLNLMQKVDSIIAENPNLSLDELVAARKINNDQKAQALKKPALQQQLSQLEEQLAQYRKFDQEYQQKLATEKELLQNAHKEELEKLRQTFRAEAEIEAKKAFKQRMLTFSRFLRAAAARRQLEDDGSDLTKAFEGALLLVYGGDAAAVDAAEKLIDGSNDAVPSTESILLSVTYAQVKQAALEEAPFAAEEAWIDEVAQAQPGAPGTEASPVGTDPTVANAGLTEIDTTIAVTHSDAAETSSVPPASSIDAGAANAAAEQQWDSKAPGSEDPLTESYEIVPRDPAETEAVHAPAPNNSIESWADDAHQVEPPKSVAAEAVPATNGTDGFHEVHHSRGGRGRGGFHGEHRGGYRGRGGHRGEGRGRGGYRGDRGDFRGRGRGGHRGGRGGNNNNNAPQAQ